jgi:hypothetical protein
VSYEILAVVARLAVALSFKGRKKDDYAFLGRSSGCERSWGSKVPRPEVKPLVGAGIIERNKNHPTVC